MRPLQRRLSLLALAVAAGTTAADAQQPPSFRAEIDSVQLDIRVVDEDGRFVRDLSRGDLQIFEDGQPQAITTFAIVDIPIAGDAGRRSTIPSDVATNAGTNQGRLFVMVLDDLITHPLRAVTVRELAKYFVDLRERPEAGERLDIATTIENEKGTSFFAHEETQSVDLTKGRAASYRHTAPIHLPSIPPGQYVLKVRAESSAAPGRPVVRQIPIVVK